MSPFKEFSYAVRPACGRSGGPGPAGKISGGSKYPVDQAKEAGVDFTKKDAYMAVVERMDNLVEELEKLLNA